MLNQGLRIAAMAGALLLVFACSARQDERGRAVEDSVVSNDIELIVLAAPRAGDAYYASAADDIFDFQVSYAREIARRDRVVVLTDAATYPAYVEQLGADHVVVAPMDDIWMRDFGLSNPSAPVMFRYTAAGQGAGRRGQADADAVQQTLADVLARAGVTFGETDLLNDGGNFVDDYAGSAVVSRKLLRDNGLSEVAGRVAVMEATGVSHVAFIESDEQGGLEHADGVVAFIGPNELVINSYADDPDYAAELRAALEDGLPEVVIHEIIMPYDGSQIYDEIFGSACGLYTNMLVTPDRIYFPQFDIPEDAVALASLRSWTDKEVVPVNSQQVCRMGGGVRCMSWQLRGDNASKLSSWAKTSK